MTIYLGCYTRDFMGQAGKLEETIYDAAEVRT